jgi:hypothetical protein
MFRQSTKSPQTETVGTVHLPIVAYVEKKTCEFAVQAARIANFLSAIGAGLAEIGFIFESFMSSFSTLRCSWGWGRLVCVMMLLSHASGAEKSTSDCTSCEDHLWKY